MRAALVLTGDSMTELHAGLDVAENFESLKIGPDEAPPVARDSAAIQGLFARFLPCGSPDVVKDLERRARRGDANPNVMPVRDRPVSFK